MKKFLLIDHGGERKQFSFDVLKEKNLESYLACSDVPDWVKKLVPEGRIIVTDVFNSVKLLSDVTSFMAERGIVFDGVGTFFEHTVTQTADLASALSLPGIDPGAARRSSSNKLLMRMVCEQAGILTPKFKIIRNIDAEKLEKGISSVGIPCVIKPIFGAESYGTIKIEDGFETKDILKELTLNTKSDKKSVFRNFTNTFLLEEYLSGRVVSVDGLVQDWKIMILGMVEFVMGPEPRFTQEANYIPARLNKDITAECHDSAKKIIKALGFDNCGFHCEMRLTEKGPVLIEIASRLPGGPLQPGYKEAFDVDLTSLLVDIWLGKKVELEKGKQKFIMQKAVFPRKEGFIKTIKGIENARKLKGVWDFVQIANEKERVVTYPDIPKPFYYYGISAKSIEKLEKLSKKLESEINVVVE